MQFRRTQKRSWPRLTMLVTFTLLFAILYVAADGETPMLSLLSHFHKHVELLPTDVRTRHCNATSWIKKKYTCLGQNEILKGSNISSFDKHVVSLQSVRVEVGTRSVHGELYTAFQLVAPLDHNFSLEAEKLVSENLPSGSYKMHSFVTSRCFTRQWLSADSAAEMQPSSEFCVSLGIHEQFTWYVTVPQSKDYVHVKEDYSLGIHANSLGYWLNDAWSPRRSQRDKNFDSKRLLDTVYIHIAGDSVARGMLGNFCAKLNATGSHTIYGSDKKVKYRHCCDTIHNRCIIFRMSWFPRETFSPRYVERHLGTRDIYCSESSSAVNCSASIPEAAFDLKSSTVWHWLFYGSHSPNFGASNKTCELLKIMSSYDKARERTLIYGTPAIREDLIPDKYMIQRRTRTNTRIAALNEFLAGCVDSNLFVDLFPATFSRAKEDFADAIHMKYDASRAISEMIWSAFTSYTSLS